MLNMTEEELERSIKKFTKQLKGYPQVGRRPRGYPKWAWWLSGVQFLFGCALQLPLLFEEGNIERGTIGAALFGVVCISFALTMRMLAFNSAVSGAVDVWLSERIEPLEKRLAANEPDIDKSSGA